MPPSPLKTNPAHCPLQPFPVRAGHQAKGEDLRGDRSHGELRRQYHCAGFNMVAAVITCTQRDLKFYTAFLFKEDLTKVYIL